MKAIEYVPILDRPITKLKGEWTCGGHVFQKDMTCKCGRTWHEHQRDPILCPSKPKPFRKHKKKEAK